MLQLMQVCIIECFKRVSAALHVSDELVDVHEESLILHPRAPTMIRVFVDYVYDYWVGDGLLGFEPEVSVAVGGFEVFDVLDVFEGEEVVDAYGF
jgi:hypothetical protein